MSAFPTTRLRRLRRTDALRSLVRETQLSLEHIVAPLFAYKHAPAVPPGSGPGGFFTGGSIAGGTFYPATGNFPTPYRENYFFADFLSRFIGRLRFRKHQRHAGRHAGGPRRRAVLAGPIERDAHQRALTRALQLLTARAADRGQSGGYAR